MAWILKRRELLCALLLTSLFLWIMELDGFKLSDVLLNYVRARWAFLSGLSPYQYTLSFGAANQFKYSPLFAAFFSLEEPIGPKIFAVLWVTLSAFVFWLGIARWHDFSSRVAGVLERSLLDFMLISVVVELFTSLGAYQANALIVGLILLATAEYRDGRFFSSGALMMLATDLKVFPVIFLVGLATRGRRRYWGGLLVTGLFAFLIPGAIVGMANNLALHREWVRIVTHDTIGIGILDVMSTFRRAHLARLGEPLRISLLAVTPILFLATPLLEKERLPWEDWMALGLASLLLLSPRTEVATFILAAPAYFLLFARIAEEPKTNGRLAALCLLIVSAIGISLASCAFDDPTYFTSELPQRIWRVLGALVIWGIAATRLTRPIVRHLWTALKGADTFVLPISTPGAFRASRPQ